MNLFNEKEVNQAMKKDDFATELKEKLLNSPIDGTAIFSGIDDIKLNKDEYAKLKVYVSRFAKKHNLSGKVKTIDGMVYFAFIGNEIDKENTVNHITKKSLEDRIREFAKSCTSSKDLKEKNNYYYQKASQLSILKTLEYKTPLEALGEASFDIYTAEKVIETLKDFFK